LEGQLSCPGEVVHLAIGPEVISSQVSKTVANPVDSVRARIVALVVGTLLE